MYKNGKWAQQLLALQDEEGKWGCFHSLSQMYGAPITTEQALRRLQRLGFTMQDPCIQRAVAYMEDCLRGKNDIPDRKEKVQDWPVFSATMLSAWIRRFTPDSAAANEVAGRWAAMVTAAFAGGTFDRERYLAAYERYLRLPPKGAVTIGLTNFYPVSLLVGLLDEKTETAFVNHLLNNENGIYYIYGGSVLQPPVFAGKPASHWLAAVELLAAYPHGRRQLTFAADYLRANRQPDGSWDLGAAAKDGIYFPLSDSWRSAAARRADCTARVTALLAQLA